MKILVLGCNGMAGSTISLYLKERGNEVFGLAQSESRYVPTFVTDVTNFAKLDEIIMSENFDIIINCIGILIKDSEEKKEIAVLINSLLPHHLAKVTHDMKTRIFHMSTDCVFSGKRGKYTEADFPDGELFYDRTKALGELADSKNLTFRNSIIGPDINENGVGLFNWFMKQTGQIGGYTKSIWTGVTTLQLAKTMEKAMHTSVSGLFNCVNNEVINKYDLLLLFKKYFHRNRLTINAVEGKPQDKSLVRTNFDLDYQIPNYETMVKEMSEWVYSHKEAYPHYDF